MPEFILDYGTPEAAQRFASLDEFTQGYIEAAFFTETGTEDDTEEELDDATLADLDDSAWESFVADCAKFQSRSWLIAGVGVRYARQVIDDATTVPGFNRASIRTAGHDFWYTRNGHGCGFWDGDWPAPHDSILERTAKAFPQVDMYRGDNGRIYLS